MSSGHVLYPVRPVFEDEGLGDLQGFSSPAESPIPASQKDGGVVTEKVDTECDIEEGDVRMGRGRPEPREPSAAEVARHNLTHMPYRSWCPHCVAARRANEPHHRGSEERHKPLLVLDYCWVTDIGSEDGTWALVGRMYPNRALFAVMCENKGATDEFTIA